MGTSRAGQPSRGPNQPLVNHIRFNSVNQRSAVRRPVPVVAWRDAAGWRGQAASGRGGRRCRAVADHEASPAWFSCAWLFCAGYCGVRCAGRVWRRTPSSAQSTAPTDTQATSSDPYADLLAAIAAESNPGNPPSFVPPGNSDGTLPPDQAPPAGKFTASAPSRIGATPVYGSPTGFGAGDTGFQFQQRAAQTLGASARSRRRDCATARNHIRRPCRRSRRNHRRCLRCCRRHRRLSSIRAKAAARPGAVLPPPPDQLPISNPPAVVYPADGRKPARRDRANSAAGGFSRLCEHAAARNAAAEHAAARDGAARHAADRRRRSLRGARHQGGLVFDSACGRIIGRIQYQSAGRSPGGPGSAVFTWSRRNCMCAPIGRAIRSPPTSPVPIPTTPTATSNRR